MAWRSPETPKDGYLQFSTMISASIIRYIYTFGALAITIGSIIWIIDEGPSEFIVFVLIIIFGNLAWRLICEAWILFFRIHEALVSIEHNTSGGQDTEDSVPDWRETGD